MYAFCNYKIRAISISITLNFYHFLIVKVFKSSFQPFRDAVHVLASVICSSVPMLYEPPQFILPMRLEHCTS